LILFREFQDRDHYSKLSSIYADTAIKNKRSALRCVWLHVFRRGNSDKCRN